MFVPIGDDNPLKRIRFQYVTVALIIVNVLAYLFELTPAATAPVVASFAVVPQELFQVWHSGGAAPISADALPVPERFTLLSYMFLHGSWMHLIGNMLFLWVFGDNVEDAMGHVRFLVFYLVCGVAAALFHCTILNESQDALVGASGAVAGVIAAYLMLHPRVDVWVLALNVIPLRITAAFALGIWILIQLVMVILPAHGPTAWWAHIGGLISGALLIPVMKRRDVSLFAR